jgi:hypothetical protein
VKETTVFIVLLLEKNSVSDKYFTFPFILLLLLSDNPFPRTGAINIEANSRNCNEIRVTVIVFILEVRINSMP